MLNRQLDALVRSLAGQSVPQCVAERIYIGAYLTASLDTNNVRDGRSMAAPVYVSDLGVRRFRDPEILFTEYFSRALAQNRIRVDEECLSGQELDTPGVLANALDAIILVYGDYPAAAHLIDISRASSSDKSYEDYLFSGVVLAALKNTDCDECFIKAAEVAENSLESYLATHRRAASLLKHRKGQRVALSLLRESLKRIQGRNKDLLIAKVLYDNLVALAEVYAGDPKGALYRLKRAEKSGREALLQLKGVERDRVGRYLGQVAINQAQLYYSSKSFDSSVRVLEEAFVVLGSSAVEFQAEALRELAYVNYLRGNYSASLSRARIAYPESLLRGDLSAAGLLRRLIIACLDELGSTREAQHLLNTYNHDKLGFNTLYEYLY